MSAKGAMLRSPHFSRLQRDVPRQMLRPLFILTSNCYCLSAVAAGGNIGEKNIVRKRRIENQNCKQTKEKLSSECEVSLTSDFFAVN